MSTVDSSQSSDAFRSPAEGGAHPGDRVYISSALGGLTQERKTVIDVVQRSGCEPVAMEEYGADTRPPLHKCLQDVRSCDVYIGIVAWRYGSCPPGEHKSFTHLEYDEARRCRKTILIFHLDKKAPRPKTHVDDSQSEVQNLRGVQAESHTIKHFVTNDEIESGVRKGLRGIYGAAGASVPALLPYTVDRSRQKESFAAAVQRGELDRSPAVVVVPGTADQAHEKFVEYMQEQLLPQHLGTANIHAVTIGLHSGDFGPDIITRRIADRCSFAPTADIDVLSRQFYESATITALWFQVAVDVRRGRPRTRDFTRLVQYFARWPTDQSLRVLPIITAEYEAAPNQRSWLRWPGAASPTRCGRAIKQAATAANPRAVVLPELANVERPQVTEWANQPEVRRRLEPDSAPEIRSFFQSYERSARQRGIPMDKLVPKLLNLLTDVPRQEKA